MDHCNQMGIASGKEVIIALCHFLGFNLYFLNVSLRISTVQWKW